MITIPAIVAVITFILAVVVIVADFYGKSKNIRKDGKAPIVLTIFSFAAYCMWLLHGIYRHDYTLIFGQGLGIITTGVLLGQLIYHKRNR